MKIKLLMDQRVIFAKGSEIEVDEREAARLLSLGFAEKVAVKAPSEAETPEAPAKVEVKEKKTRVKK